MRAVWSSRPHPHASVRRTAPRWASWRTPAASDTATTSPSANSPGASIPRTPVSPTLHPCAKGCAGAVAEAAARRVDHGGEDQEGSDAEDHAEQRQQPGAAPHGGRHLAR